MDKRKREILALGLLILLGVGVASAMAWYIFVGHNWNKAASHIDDLVGSMDGYTVVLYEGTLPQAKKTTNSTAQNTSSNKETGSAGSASAQGGASSGSSAARQSTSSSQSAAKSQRNKPVKVSKVAASYREKGATVLTIHLDDLGRYEDSIVVAKGGKRYGICSTPGPYSYTEVRDKVKTLIKRNSDFNVVVSGKPDIKKGWLRHVDLCILACEGRIPHDGRMLGSSFFVDSPHVGEVQAVIISPSGTITSKTIVS